MVGVPPFFSSDELRLTHRRLQLRLGLPGLGLMRALGRRSLAL